MWQAWVGMKISKKTNVYIVVTMSFLAIAYLMYIWLVVTRKIDYVHNNLGYHFVGGVDAYYTKQIFDNSAGRFDLLLLTHGEIGFKILMFICHKVSSQYTFFLFVFHTIAFLILVAYFIENVECKYKKYILVILICGILFTMLNTMRNDLVALFFLLAFSKLRANKNKQAILLMIIASLFHKVSIFGLISIILILLVKRIRGATRDKVYILLITLLVGTVGAIFFVIPYIFNASEYSIYVTDTTFSVGIYAFVLFLFILSIVYEKKNRADNAMIIYYVVPLIICLAMFLVQLRFSMAYRVVILFMGYIYEYSFYLSEGILKKNTLNNLICKCVLCFFALYKIYDLFAVQLFAGQIILR